MAKRRYQVPILVLALVALLFLSLVVGAPWRGPASNAQDMAVTQPTTVSVADLVERVTPAVVTVINLQRQQGPFAESTGTTQPAGSGTGFVIDDQGHVVTNEHVVRNGQDFEVIFADGTERPATLVGSDPRSDLAVVQIEGDIPATVSLADSSAARPGDPVIAIGSPLGAFTSTVTQGIISATQRDFPGQSSADEAIYSDLIQHDAAINPGNSGGPLFNLAGEVVGVNTLGIPQQNGQPVQGLFFAIPSNTVGKITEQLISQGRVAYPYFGITAPVPVTDDLVARFDLPVDFGAGVRAVVPGGPADVAGIVAGDIILEIAGQRIDQENAFAEVLFEHQPGETVDVLIQRGNEQQTVLVTLEDQPTR